MGIDSEVVFGSMLVPEARYPTLFSTPTMLVVCWADTKFADPARHINMIVNIFTGLLESMHKNRVCIHSTVEGAVYDRAYWLDSRSSARS